MGRKRCHLRDFESYTSTTKLKGKPLQKPLWTHKKRSYG